MIERNAKGNLKKSNKRNLKKREKCENNENNSKIKVVNM